MQTLENARTLLSVQVNQVYFDCNYFFHPFQKMALCLLSIADAVSVHISECAAVINSTQRIGVFRELVVAERSKLTGQIRRCNVGE